MYEIMVSGYGGEDSVAKYCVSDDWNKIEKVWSDNIESPSYLSVKNDMCFALTEKANEGAAVCYRKYGRGYARTDSIAFEGGALCYLHYSFRHSLLFGAGYQSGHMLAVRVDSYKFNDIRNLFIIQPDDINGISRAHCCVPDHNEERIFVCNISLDRVYCYNIENGCLKQNERFPFIQLEKGEGPRHIRFHPKKDIAYIITEYSNKLFTLSYDRKTGELKVIQEISTLPEGFAGESYGSTLAFSPEGKYLYAANRGADTIAVFGINEKGMLSKLQDFDCFGNCPRHIAITADGRFLMSANQESDNLAVISVSKENGRLIKQAANIVFKTPSYVTEIV